MSVYVLPQVLVYQELNLIPQASQRQQCAHISGGHAHLQRYSEADEKDQGLLGYYDPTGRTCYDWPGRAAGGLVDSTYTQINIDNALLQYFHQDSGGSPDLQTVADASNKVSSPTLSFAANGAGYPHSAVFKDRGVRVGDIAKVVCAVGDVDYTLWTSISGFVGDTIAATVGSASADDANADNQVDPAATYDQTAGDVNCVEITAVDDAAYDGLDDGDINETYTIEVIQGSFDGDAATAVLRVTSASGNDDVVETTPAAFGEATEIGTRGLTVTFDNTIGHDCSVSASEADVSAADFLVGQTWEVTCGQAWTAPTVASGGTYAGTRDCSYLVEVIQGGLFAASPQVSVTTTVGSDASGPTVVAASAGAVVIGTEGVTITFTGTGLCRGDRYYIPVTAAAEGAYRTLVLNRNFAGEVVDNGATDVAVTLYIRKDVTLTENRTESPPLTNWTQSEEEICLEEGATAFDSTWTDDDVQEALPIVSCEECMYGKAYVTYRAWLPVLCGEVNSVYDVGQLDDAISGPLHPDNPLKWGVYKALTNSNGTPVRYTSVCDPDSLDSWLRVLEILDGRDDVYGLVPLTRIREVLHAFEAHVNSQSSATLCRWRVAWFNLEVADEVARVSATTSSDDEDVLATISVDPDATGIEYTIVRVPAKNGRFVTNEVAPGNVLRAHYSSDGFDGVAYDSYTIDAVVNEDTVRLVTGPDTPDSTPAKIEVWHTYTNTEKAAVLAQDSFSNRRIMCVWPANAGSDGYVYPGYHLCAALAGLISGVAPHQGLTHLEVAGFDDLSGTLQFNRTQLDAMAGGGVWIVTQDLQTGQVYSRHALTTADYDDINSREEMITRNLDNVSFYFFDLLSPFIGISNVTPSAVQDVENTTNAGIMELTSRVSVRRLGPQVLDGTKVTECRQHVVLKDRIVLVISANLPYAVNNIETHIVV